MRRPREHLPTAHLHSFQAAGGAAYVRRGGLIGHTLTMAAHASANATKLYDRRNDQPTFDEVPRISLQYLAFIPIYVIIMHTHATKHKPHKK